MKKIILNGIPEKSKEEFVRDAFSQNSFELGFTKLHIQKKFPDCHAIDLRNKRNKEVYIEFEYEAGNFIKHGHLNKIEKNKQYLVMCWLPTGKEKVPKNIEVITLSEDPRIEVLSPDEVKKNIIIPDVLYKAIGFDPSFVEGKSIDIFNNINCFVTNNIFKDNFLPTGSIITLFYKNYFIGEFTTQKYIKLNRSPSNGYECNLYSLLSYPITYVMNLNKDNFYKSFITFTDFKKYTPQVPCNILNKKFSHGVTNLTYEDIQKIRSYKN